MSFATGRPEARHRARHRHDRLRVAGGLGVAVLAGGCYLLHGAVAGGVVPATSAAVVVPAASTPTATPGPAPAPQAAALADVTTIARNPFKPLVVLSDGGTVVIADPQPPDPPVGPAPPATTPLPRTG